MAHRQAERGEDLSRGALPLRVKVALAGGTLLVCVGLVATLVLPVVIRKLSGAVLTKAKADVVTLAGAVDSYALDHEDEYPRSLEELLPQPGRRGYLDLEYLPLDPWGRPYGYEPPVPGSARFRVFTLGKDGRPGGEGEDRDVDNLLVKEGKI